METVGFIQNKLLLPLSYLKFCEGYQNICVYKKNDLGQKPIITMLSQNGKLSHMQTLMETNININKET